MSRHSNESKWIASISSGGAAMLTIHTPATLRQRVAEGDKILGIVPMAQAVGLLDDAQGRCSQCGRGNGRHVCERCQQEQLVGGLLMSTRRAS